MLATGTKAPETLPPGEKDIGAASTAAPFTDRFPAMESTENDWM